MVSFTCGNCNETLKKNKVDLHFTRKCYNAKFVSCVDCSTDFYGNDYEGHTSCITEAEKYGGKDYVASSNGKQGQKKQDQWFDKVQQIIDDTKTDDPNMKDILEKLLSYPNVPHKKHKFINFLKNTFSRYKYDKTGLFERVWNLLESAQSDMKVAASAGVDNSASNQLAEPEATSEKPNKKENKKKRKPKLEDEEVLDDTEVDAIREAKLRKREHKSDPEQENVERLNDTLQETEKSAKDFNWESLITEILEKKGTVSLPKLRKKVVSEFVACGRYMQSEERVWKKLDKKLRAMDDVRVVSDKVSLKEK